MERKFLPFRISEVKAGQAGGWEVAGYASTFGGDPDSYGDVVAKGAFADSIAKRQTKLLWQHDMGEPIGKQLSLSEDDKGLFGRWSILPTDVGTKAHMLLSNELIDSLSIGFVAVDQDFREDGVRVLKAVDLYEVSLVTIPANSNALITSFKSQIPTAIPLDRLLANAATYLDVATSEAEALHARRSADSGRQLSEKQREAAQRLRDRAEACREALAALVTPPDAEATGADSQAHGLAALELDLATRKLRRARNRFAPAFTGVA